MCVYVYHVLVLMENACVHLFIIMFFIIIIIIVVVIVVVVIIIIIIIIIIMRSVIASSKLSKDKRNEKKQPCGSAFGSSLESWRHAQRQLIM